MRRSYRSTSSRERTRVFIVVLLAVSILSLLAVTSRQAVRAHLAAPDPTTLIYNAVSDFSKTSNPNGTWSYGWEPSLGGAFTLNARETSPYPGLETWDGPDVSGDPHFHFPFVTVNNTGTTANYAGGVSQPANVLNVHPSFTGKVSVVRWTAPATGIYSAAGFFKGIDTRNTTSDVHVLLNSSSLFSANINLFGNKEDFNFTQDLVAGDTLDFVVGWGSNGTYDGDSTGLAVTINTGGPLPDTGSVFDIPDGNVAALSAAINTANANCAEATTINLAPGGTYTLTTVAENPSEYNAPLAVGLPVIRVSITINGNGATIQRSAAPGTPDFVLLAVSGRTAAITPSCYANPVLTLNQTILTRGSQGGLHLNAGDAVVNNSTVTQNNGLGGIADACGTLTLLNSTVSYNTSNNAFGGGGIFLWGFSCGPGKPAANISFSTIFENQNITGTNGHGDPYGPGYAISNAYGDPHNVFIKNSIIASPTRGFTPGSACWAITPVSGGHNIAGDPTCGLTGTGDLSTTNPLLGPLAKNGGLTPTHLPIECSPAINAIPIADSTDTNGTPITLDQRGASRPQGGASDIGAVETSGHHATKLFAASAQGENSTNEVFRYEVGPTGLPTLDLTMTHSSLDRPFGFAVSASGELFVTNRGAGSGGGGSVSRFVNAGDIPLFNGTISSSSFDTPHGAIFRNNELFIAQRFGAGALRFLLDSAGIASFNGAITSGLNSGYPRGATINPITGELFVTECCGINEIHRYVFDSLGNALPNGVISGGGLSNPHDLTFSSWGELFVANGDNGSVSRFVFDSSGNATSNGQLSGNGLCGPIGLAFSPWGELFVSNHFCPTISRWIFDSTFNAIPNGSFSTPVTLGDIEFLPGTEDQSQLSCPSPITVTADGNCQAHIPNIVSGIAATASCGGPVTLSQSPAAGTVVGLGTTTITVIATDAANNSSSCTTTFTVTDATPPTITINTPSNGATYLLNQSVAASYSCADCGGVASCVGPVASGSNFNTASAGMKTFTVSAKDNSNNNATPSSVNYSVTYGIRVLFDQNKAAKSGSTIPIKLQLVDANGNNVSSAGVVVHAINVTQLSSSASVFLDDAGQANPDFDFRFDSALGGYIFNLKTTGYGTGTYLLTYTVTGDPLTHSVQFQVRQ